MSILVNRLHLINKLVEDHFEQIFYPLWVIMVIAGIWVFASPRPWNWPYPIQISTVLSTSIGSTRCVVDKAVSYGWVVVHLLGGF